MTRDAAIMARIERLEGKVLAAHAAIRALIACHPHPERAIATVCEHLDRHASIALAGNHPDELADALAASERVILPTQSELHRAQR
jgi:hypothetical protein